MDTSGVKIMPSMPKVKNDPTERLAAPGAFLGGLKPPSSGPDQRKKDMDAFLQALQQMRMGGGKPPGTSEQEQIISAPDNKPLVRNISPSTFSISEGGSGGVSIINNTVASADATRPPQQYDELFRKMIEGSPVPPGLMPQEVRQPKISPQEAQAREALDKQKSASIVAEIVALYHTFGQQVEHLIIGSGTQERTDTSASIKEKREAQLAASRSKNLVERMLSFFRGRKKQEAEQKAADEVTVQERQAQLQEERMSQVPDTGAKKPRGDLFGTYGAKLKRAVQEKAQLLSFGKWRERRTTSRKIRDAAALQQILGGPGEKSAPSHVG
ncbi:MAG: hypothetical protein Q8R11_03035 [bacterium]|nr:hypothetical protein [bacterium]